MAVLLGLVVASGIIALLCVPGFLMASRLDRRAGADWWIDSSWGVVAVLVVGTYWVARAGASPLWFWRLMVAVLVALLLAALFVLLRGRAARPPVTGFAIAMGGALAGVLVPMWASARGGGGHIAMTLGNGDLYTYVLGAMNLIEEGFGDSGHIAGVDFGAYVARDYLGAPAVVGFASVVAGPLEPYATAWPAMAVALMLAIGGLAALSRAIAPAMRVPALAGAVVAVMPLMAYSVGQYFISFVLGLGASALVLAGFLEAASGRAAGNAGLATALRIASGATVGLFSYPHMLVPLVLLAAPGVAVVSVLARNPRRSAVRAGVSAARPILLGLGIAAVACVGWLGEAIRQVTARAEATATGWPVPTPSPVAVWLSSSLIGADTARWLLLLAWAGAGAVALWAVWTRSTGPDRVVALAFLVAASAGGAIVVFALVPGSYGAFKMASFLIPLVWAAVIPVLLRAGGGAASRGAIVLTVFATAGLLAPIPLWTSGPTSQLSFADIERLTDHPALQGVSSVNLRMDHVIEEMAAAGVLDWAEVHFTLPVYQGQTAGSDTCTIARLDDFPAGPPPGSTVLNETYVLIPEPAPCD